MFGKIKFIQKLKLNLSLNPGNKELAALVLVCMYSKLLQV